MRACVRACVLFKKLLLSTHFVMHLGFVVLMQHSELVCDVFKESQWNVIGIAHADPRHLDMPARTHVLIKF